MKKLLSFLIVGLLAITTYGQTATYSVKTVTNNCFSEAAVVGTGHQQNAIVRYGKFVYIAFYNKSSRKVSLARSNNYGIDGWKTITFDHVYNRSRTGKWDLHNTPNVQISPVDETVHLAYDMHGGQLKYIMSVKGAATVSNDKWKKSLFGEQRRYLKEGENVSRITYPRMIIGKDNVLLFFYRKGGSGDGDSMLHRYDGKKQKWSGAIKVIDGKKGTFRTGNFVDHDRNAYFNDIQMRNGRLYVSWVWREKAGLRNHDIMFAYSDDNGLTWKNDEDKVVGTSGPGSKKMYLNTPGITVQSIGMRTGLTNQNGMAIDGDNNVHIAYNHNGEFYHLFRKASTPTTWTRQLITDVGGSRCKIYADRSTNTLYMVRRKGKEIELHATQPNRGRWNNWKVIATVKDAHYINETNSFMDGSRIKVMGVTKEGALKLITFRYNSRESNKSNDSEQEAKLSVYPNPSEGGLYQLNKTVDWKVFDIQGKQILRGNDTEINLSEHASGTYFLKNDDQTLKLLKN